MSDRMLVQRHKAASPTNTNPALASPTHLTNARAFAPQPVVTPPQAVTEVSGSVQEVQADSSQHKMPDLQAQLEKAARFGHHFSRISVQPPPSLESRLASQKGGGSPLPNEARSFMEPRIRSDFSSVRVHTDSEAVQMNRELNAQAFTHGRDIYFGAGKYNPSSSEGKRLLAHELTHVVQQKGGVQAKLTIGKPGDKYEQEADQVAEAVMRMPEPPTTQGAAVSRPTQEMGIQRLCLECEKEQQQRLAEKEEKTLQAKEIPGHTPKVAPKLEAHGDQVSHQLKEAAKSHQPKHAGSVELVLGKSEVKAKSDGAAVAHHGGATPKPTGHSSPLEAAMKAGFGKVQMAKGAAAKGETKAKGGAEAHKASTAAHHTAIAHTSQKIATEKAAAKGAAHKVSADLTATHAEVGRLGSEPVTFAPPHRQEVPNAPGHSFIAGKAEPDHAVKQQKQQRTNAGATATNFLAHGAAQLQKMAAIGQTVPPRIHNAASAAQATINATIEQQRRAAIAHIVQLQGQAHSKAAAAQAQIKGQHQAAVSAIHAGTAKAREQINTGYNTVLNTLNQHETAQNGKIDQLYAQLDQDFRAAGTKVGNEAIEIGRHRHDQFLSQCTGKDDSLLDGPVTDNRLKARANAAIQVAQEYQKGLVEEANKQANQAQNSKSKDLKTVRDAATQSHHTLEAQHKAALESLAQAEQHALSSADQAQNHLLTTISQQLTATLHSLEQQQTMQLHHLNEYGQSQQQTIEREAHNAIASLQAAVKHATSKLQGALHSLRTEAKNTPAPDVKVLQAALGKAQGQIDHAVTAVHAKVQAEITASAQGIVKGSHQGVQALNQLGHGAIQGASAVAEAFTRTVTGLTQNAHTTFTQLQTTHVKNVTANANEAVKGFQKVTTGIDTLFDKIDQHLEQGFKKSAKGLEDGLRGALKGLESDIQKYGDKAAAEVQPRWKSVLKVVLIIAVLVVVAFVMGPLLVGLGPLATIAVGALVGAASGAVIQMGNNLIDGKNLMDGVGQAALIGAIGGALGGAGGLLGKGLANAAGKLLSAGLTQSLLKGGITVGVDAASNVASGIAGDLLQGKPLTLQAILDSAIQGAALSIGMGLFSKIKTVKVDEPTVKPQEPTIKVNEPTVKPQEPTVKVNEPTVKPQEPTVKTTDTPNGRSTHMDEPEIEPGVVAKEPTADGHEIKVLKDGRVVRCSTCENIGNPELEGITDPQTKAKQAAQLEQHPKITDKVSKRSDGTYRLNRKKVQNLHKIQGEPEAVVKIDAAREAYAAELATSQSNVDKVYVGQEADRFINGTVGEGFSCDVVAVTKKGQYMLSEAKGKNIEHGLEQLEHSASQVGKEQVIRYQLVVPEELQPGYKVKDGILMERVDEATQSYKQVLIHGKPVHVVFTSSK